MKTPKTDKKSSKIVEKEKTSGKKLVQARLPFQILLTPPVVTDAATHIDTENDAIETRKRKLSYDNEDGTATQATKRITLKNTAESNVDKKKKSNDTIGNGSNKSGKQADIVLLSDDSNDEGDVSCSKENVKSSMTTSKILKQKHFESDHEADMHIDDVELVESTDEETCNAKTATPVKRTLAEPKSVTNLEHKNQKKTPTNKSASKTNSKERKSVGNTTTNEPATKVLIKLPVSTKKNKRRKSSVQQSENAEEHLSSDDVEVVSPVIQPQKRPKLEDIVKTQSEGVKKSKFTEKKIVEDTKDETLKTSPEKKGVTTRKSNNQNVTVEETKSPKNSTKQQNETPKRNKSLKNEENKNVTEVIDDEPATDTESKGSEKSLNTKDTKAGKLKTTPEKNEVATPKSNGKNVTVKNSKSPKNNKKQQSETPQRNKSSRNEENKNVVEAIDDEPAANTELNRSQTNQVDLEKVAPEKSPKELPNASEEEATNESDKSKIYELSSNSSNNEEADAETETTIKNDTTLTETKKVVSTSSVESHPTTPKISNENSSNKLHKKNLTPKQQKLLEQRLKAREEKERKIQEERLQKQREKEERELAKKREREEKDEQKRKEREEKEEQRRKERDEKERKRLAEVEMKNEEKRKRNEAKEEELRKKEEERKRKEQEKEEAELKKKKAAMAFTKFFSRPENGAQNGKTHAERQNEDIVLAFRPFQIKGAMKLAPTVRKELTDEALSTLDAILARNEEIDEEKLYIKELKTGALNTHKWIKPTQKDVDDVKQKAELEDDDDDVVLVEDELERVGQAIVEEPVAPVERLRVKFFKFAENRRPPYYGTWRKKSKTITPRKPFAQDKKFFDYEVDSDEEWEEEEPGESLNGSDDEKEKESEDEDYEVDNEWFVPHGHLSDEEMQGEDDLGENNDREAQKAKLQLLQKEFAQEMKKKTEKIKPRLIGCIWVDENGNQPELCPKIIWDTLNTRAILCAEPPILEEIEVNSDKNSEANAIYAQGNEKNTAEIKVKPITLSMEMLKELVKLVHGNTHSKNFIIKEFIAYIEANEESVRNGDAKVPHKSTVREKIDEYAQWQVTENDDSNSNQDMNSSAAKKKKNKKKLCWVVSLEKLKEMEMENLNLNNKWEYILQPREAKPKTKTEDASSLTIAAQVEDSNEHSEASVEQTGSPTSKVKPKTDIKKFAKVLTAAEMAQQLHKSKETLKTTPSTKSSTGVTTTPSSKKQTMTPSTAKSTKNNNNNTTPTVKKRVPLLMSVARGQTISTPDKNARISQFLKTLNDAKQNEKAQTSSNDSKQSPPTPMDVDEVVVLN